MESFDMGSFDMGSFVSFGEFLTFEIWVWFFLLVNQACVFLRARAVFESNKVRFSFWRS